MSYRINDMVMQHYFVFPLRNCGVTNENNRSASSRFSRATLKAGREEGLGTRLCTTCNYNNPLPFLIKPRHVHKGYGNHHVAKKSAVNQGL